MTTYRELARLLETLPDLVQASRAARGLSFRQAAEEIGLSHTAIWRYEHRVDEPNATQLRMILHWLDGGS